MSSSQGFVWYVLKRRSFAQTFPILMMSVRRSRQPRLQLKLASVNVGVLRSDVVKKTNSFRYLLKEGVHGVSAVPRARSFHVLSSGKTKKISHFFQLLSPLSTPTHTLFLSFFSLPASCFALLSTRVCVFCECVE